MTYQHVLTLRTLFFNAMSFGTPGSFRNPDQSRPSSESAQALRSSRSKKKIKKNRLFVETPLLASKACLARAAIFSHQTRRAMGLIVAEYHHFLASESERGSLQARAQPPQYCLALRFLNIHSPPTSLFHDLWRNKSITLQPAGLFDVYAT